MGHINDPSADELIRFAKHPEVDLSKLTVGNVVSALRRCKSRSYETCDFCTVECTFDDKAPSDYDIADFVESQGLELVRITDELLLKNKKLESLTVSLEQALHSRAAAIADIKELLEQDDWVRRCWACNKKQSCKKGIFCSNPGWRGITESKDDPQTEEQNGQH